MINTPDFNGAVYTPELDHERLSKQHEVIKDLMIDGVWRTLNEIQILTGYPEASISAQLRHLRKSRFGSYRVEKRRRGAGRSGLYEYQLLEPIKFIEEYGQFKFLV